MSTQQTDRGNGGAEVMSGNAGVLSGAQDSRVNVRQESSTEPQNPGSARSDYGDLAYGGRLNEEGLEPGAQSYSGERKSVQSSGRTSTRTSGGGGFNAGWTLLVGMGLGASLMYILDPDKGARRRALLRDKLVAFSNDAADAVASKSRHLRNRAQGVIAETRGLLRSNDEERGAGETQPQQGESSQP